MKPNLPDEILREIEELKRIVSEEIKSGKPKYLASPRKPKEKPPTEKPKKVDRISENYTLMVSLREDGAYFGEIAEIVGIPREIVGRVLNGIPRGRAEWDLPCPICEHDYTNTAKSESICYVHHDWLITTCEVCGQTKFSESLYICNECAGDSPEFRTGKPYPRWRLMQYGYEGYE